MSGAGNNYVCMPLLLQKQLSSVQQVSGCGRIICCTTISCSQDVQCNQGCQLFEHAPAYMYSRASCRVLFPTCVVLNGFAVPVWHVCATLQATAAVPHPKLPVLAELLKEHFQQAAAGGDVSGAIVFCSERVELLAVMQYLKQHAPGVKCRWVKPCQGPRAVCEHATAACSTATDRTRCSNP